MRKLVTPTWEKKGQTMSRITSVGEATAQKGLLDLPDEILLHILSHLSADDAPDLLTGAGASCLRLRRLCSDPSLWEDVGLELRLEASPREDLLWSKSMSFEERRNVFAEETDELKRKFGLFCSRWLYAGTRVLRLRVSWRGQDDFKARYNARPR